VSWIEIVSDTFFLLLLNLLPDIELCAFDPIDFFSLLYKSNFLGRRLLLDDLTYSDLEGLMGGGLLLAG
jgi:hypothetical protein